MGPASARLPAWWAGGRRGGGVSNFDPIRRARLGVGRTHRARGRRARRPGGRYALYLTADPERAREPDVIIDVRPMELRFVLRDPGNPCELTAVDL